MAGEISFVCLFTSLLWGLLPLFYLNFSLSVFKWEFIIGFLMIKVEIVTPKGYAYSGEVELVNIPTEEGEIGVLENHMHLISSLKPGLVFFNGNKEEGFFVTEGFVEITPKKVNILAEEATPIGEIDPGEVKKKYEELVKKLAAAKTLEELEEIEKEREIYEVLMSLVLKK